MLGFFERCVPLRERDAHFVRDVCFASDARSARESEHITSLCTEGATHRCAVGTTSLRQSRNFTFFYDTTKVVLFFILLR